MGILNRLFGTEQKVRVAQSVMRSLGTAIGMRRETESYVKEGYAQNVLVFRCVDIISKAVASIPISVRQGGDEVSEDHPIRKLLDRPNPIQSGRGLIENFVAWRLITGNSYMEKMKVKGSKNGNIPKELWVFPATKIKVVVPKQTFIPAGFVFEKPDWNIAWKNDPTTAKGDLLQWKTFNPENPFLGLSPLSAAAYDVDQHNAAGKWNFNLLMNSAEPSGVLKTESMLSEKQFQQLQMRIEQQQSGPDNARRALILEGDLEWTQTALTPRDMDWTNGRNMSANHIAAAYGVPTQLIPLPGSQTFANYEQARQSLYEDVAIPLHQELLDEFNRWLVPDFGEGYSLRADIDDIPALAARRRERWDAVSVASWLTIDEKREATGYEPKAKNPDDENDPHNQILIPAGLLPLAFDSMSERTTEGETEDEEEDEEDIEVEDENETEDEDE